MQPISPFMAFHGFTAFTRPTVEKIDCSFSEDSSFTSGPKSARKTLQSSPSLEGTGVSVHVHSIVGPVRDDGIVASGQKFGDFPVNWRKNTTPYRHEEGQASSTGFGCISEQIAVGALSAGTVKVALIARKGGVSLRALKGQWTKNDLPFGLGLRFAFLRSFMNWFLVCNKWLGPHFGQYAICMNEEALAGGFSGNGLSELPSVICCKTSLVNRWVPV